MHPAPGRCQARTLLHAPRQGMNGPQLAPGILGASHTRVFRRYSPGNVPQGRRLSLVAILSRHRTSSSRGLATRAFAMANSSYRGSTRERCYPSPFAPEPVRYAVVQGATELFSRRRENVERSRLKPNTPHHCRSNDVACGGLKPLSVNFSFQYWSFFQDIY